MQWIARATENKGGTTYVLYAAWSFPKWGQIREAIERDKKALAAFVQCKFIICGLRLRNKCPNIKYVKII